MTDSDAPKPAKASSKTSPQPGNGPNSAEADPAEAEKNLQEPSESPSENHDSGSAEQAAMDMMSALCRDFGLPGFSADPTAGPGQQPQQPQPMETAFQIIQRYLLDGDTPTAPNTSTSNPSTEAPAEEFGGFYGGYQSDEFAQDGASHNSATPNAPRTGDAHWAISTTHADGSTTDMSGPVIHDDMFRTAMPSLQGSAGNETDTPDWSISMAQGHPMSPTKTSAHTAISAKMLAPKVPNALRKWSLHVGTTPDARSALSVTAPNAVPSQLRALLFDTAGSDSLPSQISEVPIYSGEPHALHLEQTVGTAGSEATPDLASIRLIFANHAPIPVQLEYVGSLPSPIVAGNVVIEPNVSIPFWAQITPPSDGDKGAGLIVLVRYESEISFDVTAQLMTKARTSTPTAILTCNAQSDHSACRAASMIADSRGRLETSLTGLPDDPDVADLEKYGFIPPAFMLDTAKTASTATSAETQSDASGVNEPTINEPASKSTDDGDANSTTTPARQSTAKPSTRATKSKGGNTGRAGSSKGGS